MKHMKRLTLSKLFFVFCVFILFSCGPKKLPPDEPPIAPGDTPSGEKAPPTEKEPYAPATPPPSRPPKEALPAPAPKPRAPARGDTASSKLLDRGVKAMNEGNLDEAGQLFEQALRVSPTNGKPYYYLGVLSAKQQNYDRSLNFLEQAEGYLHEDPFWMSQILLQEGLTLKALGRKSDAKAKFEEALRVDPSNQDAARALKTP
jgi:TolA-binding protein